MFAASTTRVLLGFGKVWAWAGAQTQRRRRLASHIHAHALPLSRATSKDAAAARGVSTALDTNGKGGMD
jgi:hypothetical protein